MMMGSMFGSASAASVTTGAGLAAYESNPYTEQSCPSDGCTSDILITNVPVYVDDAPANQQDNPENGSPAEHHCGCLPSNALVS
jgi:hypothetical protein